MENNNWFLLLLQRYFEDDIAMNELDEFFQLLATDNYDPLLENYIQENFKDIELDAALDLPPHIAQEIIRNIFNAEKSAVRLIPAKRRKVQTWHLMAVAASLFILIFSAFFFHIGNNKPRQQLFTKLIPLSNINKKNNLEIVEIISLSDGSKISLSPHSAIHYPLQFSKDKREVYLEGKAFFQIAKNPGKPFIVYYNNVVAKVLGTSFTIDTNPQSGNVEVEVKTGKVQVYENEYLVKKDFASKAVIVTPNQKVIYKINNRTFETTLVEKPLPVTENDKQGKTLLNNEKTIFIYDKEKLFNVFKQLESSFGIEIIPENSNINNCLFTGDLTSDDLFKMLRIICITTNSSYEINGTKILIKGQGCY